MLPLTDGRIGRAGHGRRHQCHPCFRLWTACFRAQPFVAWYFEGRMNDCAVQSVDEPLQDGRVRCCRGLLLAGPAATSAPAKPIAPLTSNGTISNRGILVTPTRRRLT